MVGLVEPLFTNKRAEDAIRGRHSETDARRNDGPLILLTLFVPWNQLPEKFFSYEALMGTYIDYYWNIWEDAIEVLEEYTQYTAKHILQIKKSQLDAKLHRDLRNVARNHQAADVEIFNGEDNNDDDREEEGEEELENNIDVPTADSYSHAVAITRMHWQKQDTIECLEYSILSHAHHALCMADDVRMSNQDIGYV